MVGGEEGMGGLDFMEGRDPHKAGLETVLPPSGGIFSPHKMRLGAQNLGPLAYNFEI